MYIIYMFKFKCYKLDAIKNCSISSVVSELVYFVFILFAIHRLMKINIILISISFNCNIFTTQNKINKKSEAQIYSRIHFLGLIILFCSYIVIKLMKYELILFY